MNELAQIRDAVNTIQNITAETFDQRHLLPTRDDSLPRWDDEVVSRLLGGNGHDAVLSMAAQWPIDLERLQGVIGQAARAMTTSTDGPARRGLRQLTKEVAAVLKARGVLEPRDAAVFGRAVKALQGFADGLSAAPSSLEI